MELRHLRYFKAVAEHLSFTAAARQLGMAQPPLSTQIRNLEREIGTPLFTRSRRSIQLTPAGRSLLTAATDILNRADAAVLDIQDEAAGRSGTLRLSATTGALSERVTRRIRKFVRKHRGVRLQLLPPDAPETTTDVSLRDLPAATLPAEAISLEVSLVEVVMPQKHRLAERPEILLSDLVGETLLTSPTRSAAEELALTALTSAGIPGLSRREVAAPAERFWPIALGLGLGFAAAHEIISWDVVRRPLPEVTERVALAALPQPTATSLALPAFLEALRPD